MSHLDHRALDTLLDVSVSEDELLRIRDHADSCRACARVLEEWRDHFPEINRLLPEDAIGYADMISATGSRVLVPENHSVQFRRRIDTSSVIWVMAVVLALVVGYSASRLRGRSSEGLGTVSLGELPPSSTRPAVQPPAPPASDTISDQGALGTSERTPGPVVDSTPVVRPATPAPVPTATPSKPPADASTTMPQFRRVAVSDAARRLKGGIRTIRGLSLDHIEIGPGTAVPGAPDNLDVVRVVYQTSEGYPILLDQQRIPADSSGFRPINESALESGDTLLGTSPSGVSVATWIDDDGYRMSLVLHGSTDSLRRVIRRVH